MNALATRTTPAPTAPVIELRKFHFAEFASEETNCYSAEVWVNGRPGFHASNEGHGGSDHYQPLAYTDKGRADMDTAMAAIKAYCDARGTTTSHGIELEYDAELFIGDAVEEMLRQRERQKIVRKTKDMVVMIEDGQILRSKKVAPDRMLHAIAHFQTKYPKAIILNGKPEAEQIAILKALDDKRDQDKQTA